MIDGHWVESTIISGQVCEKTKYWVPGKKKSNKVSRRDIDRVRKQKQNEYSAVKQLARVLNANFSGGDLVVCLTYSQKGMKKIEKWISKQGINLSELDEEARLLMLWEAADHEMVNFLRRLKRRAQKEGLEVKSAYITSDMDGDTGEIVRVHHHMVVNREVKELLQSAWGEQMGAVEWEKMWTMQEDRTPIAEYMLKQVRKMKDSKKYRTTRNLYHPEAVCEIVLEEEELAVPAGGRLIYRAEFRGHTKPQYIRFILPKATPAA